MSVAVRKSICAIALSLCGFLLCNPLQAQWHFPVIPGTLPNTATALGNDCFQFTSTTLNRGVVWDSVQVNLSQAFDMRFTVSQSPDGADGLAFVLQNVGLNSWGDGGNANGYASAIPLNPAYPGINPSVAIELDCFDNSGAGVADIPADHIAVHTNGNLAAAAAGPAAAIPNGSNITDGQCRVWRIVWAPAPVSRFDIYFNNQLRLSYNNDVVTNFFGGNPLVWWGLTGSSGGVAMTQTVCVSTDFANAGPDQDVCAGDTLQLNATGGVTYFWGQGFPIIDNQNIPNPNFSSILPIPYQLTLLVTNATGCTDRDTVIITVVNNPTANAGPDDYVCLGDSIRLGVPATPNYTYAWTPSAGLSSTTVAQPWFTSFATGTSTFYVSVTDISSTAMCTRRDSVLITILDTPTVSITPPSVTACEGSDVTLNSTTTGGAQPYTYAWSTGGNQTNETFTALNNGNVGVTVTDANTCTSNASVAITVNDTPVVSVVALPDTICAGQSAVLDASGSSGNGNLSFAWSTGATTAATGDSPLATTTYTVSVTDGNNCVGVGTIEIVVNVSDSIDITVSDTFSCNLSGINIVNTFQTSGINAFTWSPSTGVSNPSSANPTITPTTSTTYYLIGENTLTGCGYTDSIRIEAYELLVSHFTDTTVCRGDTLRFDIQPTGGSGDYTYLWTSSVGDGISDDTIPNPYVLPTNSGTFSVMITDTVTECVNIFNIQVTVSQLQVVATPPSELINPGQRVQLEATGAMFFTWTPDSMLSCNTCPNPVAMPTQTITYTVLGSDTSGCQGEATVTITVDSLLVPNVLTPNGDGINDVLELNYYGNGFYQILIYDRWGHQIFSTEDRQARWDGTTASGADAPEGVYFLAVRIVGDAAIPDKDKQRVFAVTLMR